MFCPKCGTQIDSNSQFCSRCGYSVTNQNTVKGQPVYQQNPVKPNQHIDTPARSFNTNEDLRQLYSAENYAKTLQPYLERIEDLKEIEKNYNTAKTEMIVAAVLMVILLFINIAMFAKKVMLLPVLLLFFTLSAVGVFIFMLIKMITAKAKFPPGGCQAEIQRLYSEFDNLLSRDAGLQQDFQVFQALFPYGATLNQVNYMIMLFETHRTVSFHEALKLYDEHMHREQMTELARQQNEIARDIARSAERTANAAEESAMYNRMNLFK